MDRTDLLARISWLYYIEELTQHEIGERLNLPRIKVTRLLKEARNEGIIEFHITKPIAHLELERDLIRTFKLQGAFLLPTPLESERLSAALGEAATQFLTTMLQSNMLIGLGMGRTLAEIPGTFQPPSDSRCDFVEMVGGAGRSDLGFDTYNVSWRLAELSGGTAYHVFCPVVVESKESREALLQDPQIASTLHRAAHCDLALVGIGTVSEEMLLYKLGYSEYDMVLELRALGAVGDILGHFFDVNGQLIPYMLSDRLIALSPEQLCSLPIVVAVAGGPEKCEAILGALRGGYIDALVTDTDTAVAVLERSRNLLRSIDGSV